jgi:hypothetical protein
LVLKDIFRTPHIGGMISVPTAALPALASTVKSKGFQHSWICNGAIMLVEGPCGVTVLSFSSHAKGTANSISILEKTVVDILAEHAGALTPRLSLMYLMQHVSGDEILVIDDEARRFSTDVATRRPMSILNTQSMDEAPHIENFQLHVSKLSY